MTNEQLKGARRAQNRYPEAVFTTIPGGVRVNGADVLVTENMTAEDVYRALMQAVLSGQGHS
jgi:hypothetical protein